MLSKIIREARRAIYRLPVFPHANALEVDVKEGDWASVAKQLHWGERRPFLRIHLPVSMVTMEGALHYSAECNPFVAMLNNGEADLHQHYDRFQPTNLAQMFRLKETGRTGEALPQNTLPWIWFNSERKDFGEMGLGPEHGVSYFGPVTAEKFTLECKRLTETLSSVQSRGYLPNRHGDISGYFLRRDGEFRFKVRGGKHRAAVLVHQGWKKIPVRMKQGWPRVIDRAHVGEWPEVAAGNIDAQLALDVFDRHFDAQTLSEIHAYRDH